MSNLLPQPTASASSATGNPRNKTALKPGHSLMDWIRLRSSDVDLAGTKGVVTPVSLAELKKHNKKNDAWLAIRGKVYNVTRYMDFHPGGVDELMKGVGMDATKVFDDVHAWVNYDQMLSKCYIGPLRAPLGSSAQASSSKIVSSSSSSQLTSSTGLTANGFRLPFSLSANNFMSNSLGKSPPSSQTDPSCELSVPSSETDAPDVIPRFDWIQKTSDLVLIFYTRAYCNPGLLIEYLGGGLVEVKIFVEGLTYLAKFTFTENVTWPCAVRKTIETGKCEITFKKAAPQLWPSYGTMEMTKNTAELQRHYKYNVSERWPLTHDSFALILNPVAHVLLDSPIGYHISICCRISGDEVVRSYTPVPFSYVEQSSSNDDGTRIALLIKAYNNTGTLSKHLCESSPMVQGLEISCPKGSFSLSKLKNHTRIAFLAAGSGLTPFLGIMDHLMGKPSNQLESVRLYFYNKTERDIWCRTKLDALCQRDTRFQMQYILSEANEDWDGERGRVSRDLITTLTDPCSRDTVTFFGVCGPPTFNRQIVELLKDVGFPAVNQHIFQG